MPFWREYLRSRLGRVLLYGLFAAIFILCFALSGVPTAAAVYPALICAATGGAALFVDWARQKRRYDELQRLLASPDVEGAVSSARQSLFDRQQQQIIASLQVCLTRERQSFEDKRSDMLDYYSLWAHQIKTPMASLAIAASEEDSPLARRVKTELGRIGRYVDMVMAYMRLESSTTDYVFRRYSLDEMIRKVIRRFAPDFISGKIALRYAPTDLTIVTDEKWFGFILEQLISNCLKYTQQGSVTIAVEGKLLRITDTGIGIAPADLPRIFEKGYTGFTGRQSAASSGIGLYLTRRVCDNLGIGIRADSDSSGTTMTLDLSQSRLRQE